MHWRATGQSNLADRMEDCSTGQSAVVWVRKTNFGSFCCSQPFVRQVWLSSGPPELSTFSYCAWLWNWLIGINWSDRGSHGPLPKEGPWERAEKRLGVYRLTWSKSCKQFVICNKLCNLCIRVFVSVRDFNRFRWVSPPIRWQGKTRLNRVKSLTDTKKRIHKTSSSRYFRNLGPYFMLQ